MIFLDTSAVINLLRELYEQEHNMWTFIKERDIAITPMVVNELNEQKLKVRRLDKEFGSGGGKSWLLIREFIKQVRVKQPTTEALRNIKPSQEYRNLLSCEDAIIFQEFLAVSSENDKLYTADDDFNKEEIKMKAEERERTLVYINVNEQGIKDKILENN